MSKTSTSKPMEAVAMLLYIATGDLEDGIKLRTMMEKAQPMLTKWTPTNSRILQSRDLPCCCQKGRRAEGQIDAKLLVLKVGEEL